MPHIEFERATSYEDALARAADECGIQREYWDIFHKKHEVSSDVRRRILQGLGWDVSSFDAVEQERSRRFDERSTSALGKTLVISRSDCAVPLTLAAAFRGSIHFEIALEEGQRVWGRVDTSELRRICDIAACGQHWMKYE